MDMKEGRFFSKVILVGFAAGLISGAMGGIGLTYAFHAGWIGPYGLEVGQGSSVSVSALHPKESDDQIISVVARALPSVVSIEISADVSQLSSASDGTGQNFFNDPFFNFPLPEQPDTSSTASTSTQKQLIGGGTGFFISSDGLIATNKHVIQDKNAEYTVVLQNGEKYVAKVVAIDPVLDLGMLKIEGDHFPYLELGDSDGARIGQTVIAIGNALGEFQNTVTKGVISGKDRNLIAGDIFGTDIIEGAIQTDAAINPGNSGGPLLDLNGKVVGINTAISDGAQSLGFALPSNVLQRANESVQKYGRIVRPWIGVRYITLDKNYADIHGISYDHGVVIAENKSTEAPSIIKDSPADKADLKEGDIILEVNGEPINEKHSLSGLVAKYAPGDPIKLKIARGDQEMEGDLLLEERPADIK